MLDDRVLARGSTIRKISWWHYRSGPTRSHPEHGRETLQGRW